MFYCIVTFLGALCGKFVVGYLVKKYNRTAFIVFILAGIITFSVIAVSILGVVDLVASLNAGSYMGFHMPC